MIKFIKIELNIDKPQETLLMGAKIVARDTALGVDSPMEGYVDMADYAAKVTSATAKRAEAEQKDAAAQSAYQLLKKQTGTLKNTKRDDENTLQWYVGQTRRILILKNRGNEEALSLFGFHVVVTFSGGRRFVRIEKPREPQDMIDLARHIVDHHILLAGDSPLVSDDIDMDAFQTLLEACEAKLANWETLRGQVQALHLEALNIIGYGPGQTLDTEGTLYHMNRDIRDRGLQKYQGNEEELSTWGFKVVITTKKSGRKKGEPLTGAVILIIDVVQGNFKQVDPGDFAFPPSTSVKVEAMGANGKLYAASTPTSAPGAGATQDVVMGTPYITTISALKSTLGINDTTPLLMIQNPGPLNGTYRFTFGD